MKPRLRSAPASSDQQRGATLIVGLIMLVLITMIVVSAFTLSDTNLRSVGNMQARDSAVAAANQAIEQVIGSAFASAPTAEEINVDSNNDGVADYAVNIAQPVCIRAYARASGGPGTESDVDSGIPGAVVDYNSVWEITATVNDAVTGASVRVTQGVRVLLTETEKNSVCA